MRRATVAVALAGLVASVAACTGEAVDVPRARSQPPPLTAVPAKPKPRPEGLPAVVRGTGTLTAYLTQAKVLHARPGGRRLAVLNRLTEFGSPRIVTVLRRRGPWLAVLASPLPNGRIGWVDGRRGVELYRTPWSVAVDLSARTVIVRRDNRVVARTRVAIGSPSSPTPQGRFAVTDKLTTGSDGGPYGCCVLALTGHQPNIPQGWGGGDRLAIHATPSPETIGFAASHGCLRATNAVMRRLVRDVPLGTRVRIRA